MIHLLLLTLAALLPATLLAQPAGLPPREPNTTLLISDPPSAPPAAMRVVRVFPQLSFTGLLFLTQPPGDDSRFFAVQQNGLVRVFPNIENPTTAQRTTYIDVSSRLVSSEGERGLLGMAFDPDFATNGEFYLHYSAPGGNSAGRSRISRFTADPPNAATASLASEEIILEVQQDFNNHNGGMIAFGPDGMLYIALGDGGSGNDPNNRAQTTTNLLGNILRIDVRGTPDAGLNYRIPPDNPFFVSGPAGTSTRKEIYAYGLRNPWRFSFDAQNGFLIAGDVGQNAREEIDHIKPGLNYGWRIAEGTICTPAFGGGCNLSLYEPPLIDYAQTGSRRSVTGGYVSYSPNNPDLFGVYLYADFQSGEIFGLRYDGENVQSVGRLVDTSFLIASFGQGNDGEIYVLDYFGGIYVLRPAVGAEPTTFPTRLSDIPALLAAGSGQGEPIPGVVPYRPSTQLWSDGALKERYIAMPGTALATYREVDGWDFPTDTVIVKNFVLPTDARDPMGSLKRLETRVMYYDTQWHFATFEWNDEETDAVLLTNAKARPIEVIDAGGQPSTYVWNYPSRSQCLQCHTPESNYTLGVTTKALNSDFAYQVTGVTDNQLRAMWNAGYIGNFPAVPIETLPAMPDAFDTSATLAERARAYLAANCSMCHRPGQVPQAPMDLRWETPLEQAGIIGVEPSRGDLGIPGALIVTEGNPDASVLLGRMVSLDPGLRMPPLSSSVEDEEATALMREWIDSLGASGVQGWRMLGH